LYKVEENCATKIERSKTGLLNRYSVGGSTCASREGEWRVNGGDEGEGYAKQK
jgi:hypothetical protein